MCYGGELSIIIILSTALTILCIFSPLPVREELDCTFSNEVTEVLCSYDNLPAEECPPFPFVFDSLEFGSDQHTLTINATDEYNQTVNFTYTFQLDERKYRCHL